MIRNLREYAETKFKRDGVQVKGNSKIVAVGPDWIELEGEGRGTFDRSVAHW
jgi:NADH dehydrogenase